MAIETFDQRFKRLTSDMLMLDICRGLGIEIRELMKIRSGIRVELSMERMRRLCQEQGLDFASFTRDYAAPWSSELPPAAGTAPAQTVTSDSPTPARRRTAEPSVSSRTSHVPVASHGEFATVPASSMVGRLKAAVAGAAAMIAPEIPESGQALMQDERADHFPVSPSRSYPEPKKAESVIYETGDQATINTILTEVSDLKREVSLLSARIHALIGR